jgi:hypothetical protein
MSRRFHPAEDRLDALDDEIVGLVLSGRPTPRSRKRAERAHMNKAKIVITHLSRFTD